MDNKEYQYFIEKSKTCDIKIAIKSSKGNKTPLGGKF